MSSLKSCSSGVRSVSGGESMTLSFLPSVRSPSSSELRRLLAAASAGALELGSVWWLCAASVGKPASFGTPAPTRP